MRVDVIIARAMPSLLWLCRLPSWRSGWPWAMVWALVAVTCAGLLRPDRPFDAWQPIRALFLFYCLVSLVTALDFKSFSIPQKLIFISRLLFVSVRSLSG